MPEFKIKLTRVMSATIDQFKFIPIMAKKTRTMDTIVYPRAKNNAVSNIGALTRSPVPAIIGSLRANRFLNTVDR